MTRHDAGSRAPVAERRPAGPMRSSASSGPSCGPCRGSGGRMRKIVVHMMLSLDGFFEGPDHDLSWHRVDEELHAHFNEQLATMSAFVEGRVTYELMEAVWPTADQNPEYPPTMRQFAGIWRAVPKIVFSRTLQEVGPNALLRAEVDPDEIRALKQQPGGDMTLGGVDLAETFRRLDLVDEYRLYVAPVLVGRGRRLFDAMESPTDLELVAPPLRQRGGHAALRHPAPLAGGPTAGRSARRRAVAVGARIG